MNNIETWCNRVAAELLVPLPDLRREMGHDNPLKSVAALARIFKVSTLVILRRILDAKRISHDQFQSAYGAELARLTERPRAGGGDFYLTQAARLSRRFVRAHNQHTGRTDALSRRLSDAGDQERTNPPQTWPIARGAALMLYLLDTNVFIQAKNLHYGLDFCPAFWDWLIDQNRRGHVHSIEKVSDELAAGNDELTEWAASRGDAFFLSPNQEMLRRWSR